MEKRTVYWALLPTVDGLGVTLVMATAVADWVIAYCGLVPGGWALEATLSVKVLPVLVGLRRPTDRGTTTVTVELAPILALGTRVMRRLPVSPVAEVGAAPLMVMLSRAPLGTRVSSGNVRMTLPVPAGIAPSELVLKTTV